MKRLIARLKKLPSRTTPIKVILIVLMADTISGRHKELRKPLTEMFPPDEI